MVVVPLPRCSHPFEPLSPAHLLCGACVRLHYETNTNRMKRRKPDVGGGGKTNLVPVGLLLWVCARPIRCSLVISVVVRDWALHETRVRKKVDIETRKEVLPEPQILWVC